MNSPSEYIKTELNRLAMQFDNISLRYEYHRPSYTHFVEVLPGSLYHNDDDFLDVSMDFADAFSKQFPTEYLAFVTDDSVYKLANPIYTVQGCRYKIPFRLLDNAWSGFIIPQDFTGWVTDIGCASNLSEMTEITKSRNLETQPYTESHLFCNIVS